MDLGAYLGMNKIAKARFAKMIGCSTTHFCMSTNGRRIPSSDLAFKVEEVTAGKVKAEEFLTYCIREFKTRKSQEERKK